MLMRLGLSSNSRLLVFSVGPVRMVFSVGPVRMFSMLGAENSRRVFSAMTSGTGVELPLDSVDSGWKLLVNHNQVCNTLYKI